MNTAKTCRDWYLSIEDKEQRETLLSHIDKSKQYHMANSLSDAIIKSCTNHDIVMAEYLWSDYKANKLNTK